MRARSQQQQYTRGADGGQAAGSTQQRGARCRAAYRAAYLDGSGERCESRISATDKAVAPHTSFPCGELAAAQGVVVVRGEHPAVVRAARAEESRVSTSSSTCSSKSSSSKTIMMLWITSR